MKMRKKNKCDKKYLRKLLKQHEYLEKTFRKRGKKFDDVFSKDLAKSHKRDIRKIKNKLKGC